MPESIELAEVKSAVMGGWALAIERMLEKEGSLPEVVRERAASGDRRRSRALDGFSLRLREIRCPWAVRQLLSQRSTIVNIGPIPLK